MIFTRCCSSHLAIKSEFPPLVSLDKLGVFHSLLQTAIHSAEVVTPVQFQDSP